MHIIRENNTYISSLSNYLALDHLAMECISSNNAIKIEEQINILNNRIDIFEELYPFFYTFYPEMDKVVFYTKIKEVLEEYLTLYTSLDFSENILKMSQEEKNNFHKKKSETIKSKAFQISNEHLKNSHVKIEKTLYKIPFLFNNFQIGYFVHLTRWFDENNQEYIFPTIKKLYILNENGENYELISDHSYFMNSNINLVFPEIPKIMNKHEKLQDIYDIETKYNNDIIDMLDFGVLKKTKIK